MLFKCVAPTRRAFIPRNYRIGRAFACGSLLIVLFAAGGLPSSAHASEPPLTLLQAQRRAVEISRQVAAQEHAIAASREMAVAAGQFPDPVLKAGVENFPVQGPDRFSSTRDFMTMRSIGVMQEITRSDKRRLRAERFEKEAEKGRAERDFTVASVERETALAWFDRYYAERMAELIAAQSAQAKLEIEAAQAAYRAGRGSQADVLAARSELVALDDSADEIRRRIANAKLMLARWIGKAAESPLAEKPQLDLPTLDHAQLASHPQLTTVAKQHEIAQTEARLAEANRRPDWSVELMFNQRPAYDNMVSIAVSIPLPWDRVNRQDRELASKLAMADQAKAQYDDALRAHIAEVRATINEWSNNRERIARLQRELVPLAEERTQAAFAAYRGGKGMLADVLMARRNELEVRMQVLQLDMETARLWAQINFLAPQSGATANLSADGAVK